MTPEELTNLPLELESMFYDLQDRIMTDVVRRINKTGGITSTADYQLQKYNILGGTTEMIESEIKRLSGKTDAAIWEIYDQVIESDYTRYKGLYEQINGSFLQYDDPENEILQSWVSGIVAQTQNGVKNISRSLGFMIDMGNGKKAFTPLADYYQKYVDAACLDIVTGSFSYDQVLRKTVKQMTASGLQTVDYASGWHNRAPVAVRRAVMTGVHQISNNINEMVAKQLGTDYFEVTAHAGARPSHMTWQGKVFKHSDLVSVCGLGDVGGLCGANCRHSYYAFFPGISSRAYSDEQLQQIIDEDMQTKTWQGVEYNGYERTQKQRQYETLMRSQRAQIKQLKEAGVDKEYIQAAQAKYLNTMHEYQQFSAKMGLPEQMQRVYIDGLGRMSGGRIPTATERSINHKRTKNIGNKINREYIDSAEYRNKFNGITSNTKVNDSIRSHAKGGLIHREGTFHEDLYILSPRDGSVLGKNTTSTELFGVEANASVKKAVKNNKDVIGLHTHPDATPPSGSDFITARERGYSLGVLACSDGSVYTYSCKDVQLTQRFIDSVINKYTLGIDKLGKDAYNLIIEAHYQALISLTRDYDITILRR